MTVEAAPVRWRRNRPPTDGSRARTAAAESLRTANAELARQRGVAAAEHSDVVLPLRRIRERNHVAELIAGMIERGHRDSGPATE